MRYAVLLLVFVAGCNIPPSFQDKVEVQKTNGVTTSVTVHFMGSQTTMYKKQHVEACIKSLETLAADLKTVSDQMEIVEPTPKGGK